jgi:hypothetical protein
MQIGCQFQMRLKVLFSAAFGAAGDCAEVGRDCDRQFLPGKQCRAFCL